MIFDHQSENPSQWKAIDAIAAKLAMNPETLRRGSDGARQTPASAFTERLWYTSAAKEVGMKEWFWVWACPDHLDRRTGLRELGRPTAPSQA